MYYEDENNLYHYSYRKGDKVENVRDVDYTEVPNTAAKADPWEEKKPKKNRLGLKIAALALACALIGGAAGAGIRAMTSSSSPGVSLKQEGISYIACARIPCVIVNIMRAGPGLGGILPAQGD